MRELSFAAAPDMVALESGDQRLSYRELNRRSNQLAHQLRLKGVGPDSLVALEMTPSPDWAIAMVAVWKAGGACLPVDSRLPRERRVSMIEDARPLVTLTAPQLIDEAAQIARLPDDEPADAPGALAWVIYTSGSTGRPKGVMVERPAARNLFAAQRRVLALAAGSRVLQFASASFDASIAELGMALGAGATLCFDDGADVLEVMRRRRISCVTLPPSLLAALPAEPLPELRDLFAAGEACPAEVVDRWSGGRRFLNLYGPTEAAVWATWARCLPGEPVTIGGAIPNVEVFILDENFQPAKEGELCIGGAGVARGYLNLPELTAERFVTTAMGRLFRTGDWGRRLAGGELEFLGRRDRQVKVRGWRVELDEIEAVLREHGKVREAAVSALPGPLLVAHVAGTATAAELRSHLARRLPEPMLPSSFVLVDALPRTASGKLDRAALPVFENGGYSAPASEAERWLADQMAEILGVARVGLDDDFFELGGHSLALTRLGARLAERGARLSIERLFEAPTVRALAAQLQRVSPSPPLERRALPRERRLSAAERRIWLAEQLDPGLAVYNAPLLLWTDCDAATVSRRLDAVVARHDALRTTFSQGRAQLAPPRPVPLPVIDLRRSDEAELARVCAEEARRPFDLANGPLLRASWLRLHENHGALLLNLHHIITDAASTQLLVRELNAPDEAPVGAYAAYAEDENQLPDQRALDYWRQRLAGAAPLALPLDRPVPAQRTRLGGRVILTIDRDSTRAFLALASQARCTPFMSLLAAWQALLSRHSGQLDVSVGAPLTLRSRVELEPIVGCFINLVVIRTDLSGRPSFRELLGRVRANVLGALAHGDTPYDQVVGLDRRAPPFRALFTFDRAAAEELHNGAALYDLTLSLSPRAGGLAGHLEYDGDLFDAETAARLAGHFRALLARAVDRPDQPVEELPLLGDAERRRLLVEWNGAARPYPFRAVHERVPSDDAPALRGGATTLSYSELNRRANQVANHLLRLNQRGRPVAIRHGHSAEACIALLGVLKAGAISVPLGERADAILAETGAHLLDLDASASESAGPPQVTVEPEDLAYILYTSGSTGRAKGVCMPHRALANLIEWHTPRGGRTLQLAPLGFDVAFQEIFSTWCAGGLLTVADPATRRDPSLLGALIAAERIEHLFLPVVLLQQLAERYWDEPAPLAGLRAIFVSGEQLRITAELKRLFTALPECRLHNHYGPTETHVVTSYTLPTPVAEWPRHPPIGRPIDNARVYVLDGQGALAPLGVAGELHLGGDCLARGYLQRPELTAQRFIADRYGSAGGRSYRTGDRARWRGDGQLEFLGRFDEQLKIRGFRVEPGEIEAALCTHDEVQTAVVVERDGRLIAYFVPSAAPPPAARLAAHLAKRLPEYLVPSAFVCLDALPTNANGKLDRDALPPPPPPPVEYLEPRSYTERKIAEIWEQVLRLPRIGVNDDFFALGGHSLSAMQLASRVSRAFTVKLLPRNVFEHPTVGRLAARVDELLQGATA